MAFTLEISLGTLCFPLDDDSLKEDDGEGASQVELGITTCAERVHSYRGEKYSDRSTEIIFPSNGQKIFMQGKKMFL
jgi:hypothetical protein